MDGHGGQFSIPHLVVLVRLDELRFNTVDRTDDRERVLRAGILYCSSGSVELFV